MIVAGTMMTKSTLKISIALVIFLTYTCLAAVVIREAEWRNEQLNSEAAKDHTIFVDQLRYELVTKIDEIIQNPENNSTEADIKQLLDAYHNASYVVEGVADGSAKHFVVDDNGLQMWSLRGSLTFVLTTFTLIGYGDIVPLTDGGRLTIVWLTLFGAVFMLLLMTSASTVLSRMIDVLYDAVKKRVGRRPSHSPEIDDDQFLAMYAAVQNANETKLILDYFRVLVRQAVARFTLSLIFLAIIISLGAFVEKLEEKEWSWLISYYFTIVGSAVIGTHDVRLTNLPALVPDLFRFQTYSTIGFGDVMPQPFATKEWTTWYTIFFFAQVICGLSATSVAISYGISLFQTVTTTANAFLPVEEQPDDDYEEANDINPKKDQPLDGGAKKYHYIP